MQFCAYPGCGILVTKGRCSPHAVVREQARPNREVRKWYYTPLWFALRQQVLTESVYTCAQCGQIQADLAVDHIRKHHGMADLFWDRNNLQALCPTCHGKKTAAGL